jgi:hypothetical protein
MRSGAVGVVTAVTAVLGAACSSGSESADDPETSSTPTSTVAGAAMRGAPEAGTCRNVPPRGFASDYWFDNSPVVACTEPHTTETVFVSELAAPTVKAAEEWWPSCGLHSIDYVGSDAEHWSPLQPILYLPSRKQIAAGASWVRCDVGFPSDWGDVLAADGVDGDGHWQQSQRAFSAKEAAIEHADEVLPCLERGPRIAGQSIVSCRRPHMYEATGQLVVLESLDEYPSPNELQRRSVQCRDGLPTEQQASAFEVTVGWATPESFSQRITGDLVGACFVYRHDGAPLPPRTRDR